MYNQPKKQPPVNRPGTPQDGKLTNWTLSYRLKGLAIGLIAAGIFCYTYLHYWEKWLLLGAAILGYFLGWLVGHFTYTRKQ